MVIDTKTFVLKYGKTVEERLDEIWQEAKSRNLSEEEQKIFDRGYALERWLETETVLFVGVNPSFDKKKPDKGNLFWDKYDHSFFNVPKKMAEKLNRPFAHHDIFFVREKTQNKVKPMKNSYPDIFKWQMEVSKELIAAAKPKVIVIANAYVSDLFVELEGFHHFDEQLGAYVIKADKPLAGTPVFCSGMLSGQRALDIHSRKRLLWQIERALKLLQE